MKRTEWYQALMDRVNNSPLSHYVGQRLAKISRGRAEVTLTVAEHHLQGRGQLHGGWYGFISDTAGFFAVMSLCNPEDGATTLEYKINLIAAATTENSPIIAKARVVKRSGAIAVAVMDVVDKRGAQFSSAMGTYRIFPGKAREFEEKLRKQGIKGNYFEVKKTRVK